MIANALIANTIHAVSGIGGYASDKLGCVLVESDVHVLDIRLLLRNTVQINLGKMDSKHFQVVQDKFQQARRELLELYPQSTLKQTNFQLTHK